MNIDGYGFHFEPQGRSGEEGPIDPSQQYFEGSHKGDAVVRETLQNTLDNRGTHAQGPIRMEFELATMATADVPGIEELRSHLDAAAEQTSGQEGHERMLNAAAVAKQDRIDVLRVSDYNTTGLNGSESLEDPDSPLSRLTRGTGGSADDGRGGSFGIGSAVGPMASQFSTVLYASMPEDANKSVFAAYTRLASHKLDGTSLRAGGHFTRLDKEEDFEYLRPAPKIDPFPDRVEPGTDIYILGYRMADEDPELERLRDAVIDNFMVAIDRGHLVVEGIAPGNHWTLNKETLEGFAKPRPEAHAFWAALRDDNYAEEDIPDVGTVRLHVNVDDRLPKKLHTITMRKPLMRIDQFRHNTISAKYAAILICEDDYGNEYLRKLEPPQHHVWDGAREPNKGKAVVRRLRDFTRKALRERISIEVGDVVEIEGLARYLPTETVGLGTTGPAAAPSSDPDQDSTGEESSTKSGDPTDIEPTLRPPGRRLNVKVKRPAIGTGEGDEIEKGRDRGGGGSRESDGGPLEGAGEEGDGTSRIRGQDVRFRSWSAPNHDPETAVITLSLTSHEDETGDLQLVALGPGGAPEPDWELGIIEALHQTPDGPRSLTVSGNTLKDLQLTAGKVSRVDLHVPAGTRYRLEVA